MGDATRLLAACCLSICSMALIAWSSAAAATDMAQTPQAKVTLFADVPSDPSHRTVQTGLHFELSPGWHIYWANPGDSGASPRVRWGLPDGWEAGDIQWPTPIRIQLGPLTNYGYEAQVTLLVPLARSTATGPTEGRLVADVEWLVCKVECLPQSATLSLALQAPLPGANAVFEKARAQLPGDLNAGAFYQIRDDQLMLRAGLPVTSLDLQDAWVASTEWGQIAATGTQRWRIEDNTLLVDAPVGDLPPNGKDETRLLLVVEFSNGERQAYDFLAKPAAPVGTRESPPPSDPLWWMLLAAFAGGLILNLMPCVLPVLSIKVIAFAEHAHGDRKALMRHGWWFGAGVLLSFGLLAGALLLVRAGGELIGWGFQLQSPVVVALLAGLMLLVALNLSGVFEFGHRLMGLAASASGTPRIEPFFNGVLASLVATPCTAPLMGAALGFAVTRPPLEALSVFLTLGLGFATPVVLLSLMPGWTRHLPQPGPWMVRLRQWLAMPMYGAMLWLIWVLSQQVSSRALGLLLGALWLIGIAAWSWGLFQRGGKRYGWVAAAGLLLSAGLMFSTLGAPPASSDRARDDTPWSAEKVAALRANGRPVFVNFTAAWCITCKVNEQVALDKPRVREAMAKRGVAYLTGDWTQRDPAIAAELARHGRSGVPLYLLYPAQREAAPRILPALLTEGTVLQALNQL